MAALSSPVTTPITTPRRSRRRSRSGVRRLVTGLAVLAAPLGAAACQPAPPPPPQRTIRACDPSACLVAWQVVDSDGDGVSDADELMAGTDPHDAASRPGLDVVIRLVVDRKLPSYEFGRAFLVIVPADVQAAREAGREVPVDPALPATPERASTLARLGVDLDLLKGHGIDPTTDGFTLGLLPKAKGEDLPGPRVGGIPVEQVSAGAGTDQVDDCCIPLELGHGEVVEHIDYGDWQSTTYADGAQIVCSNDAGCKSYPPGSPDYYTNPDADPDSVPADGQPTEDQAKAFERLRGAAERRVENWNLPETDPEKIDDPWATVIYVDPDADSGAGTGPGRGLVFDAPRVTTAQPEGRDDLPSPLVPAPGGPGCTVGCG